MNFSFLLLRAMLTVEDVRDVKTRRAQVNHATYKNLYEAVCERIRKRTNYDTGITHLLHSVPVLVIGRPVYDVDHATNYIVDKLRYYGFKVTRLGTSLFIDWSEEPKTKKPKRKRKTTRKPVSSSGNTSRTVVGHDDTRKSALDAAREIQSRLNKMKTKFVKSP